MLMNRNRKTIKIGDWPIRVSQPNDESKHPVMLMLHGLTGDENAMEVFTRQLAGKFILLSPRGLYNSPLGGYSWHSNNLQTWPDIEDFNLAINKIISAFKPDFLHNGDFSKFYLLGFSQGAALAYSLSLYYPERVVSFAGLSGFLPEKGENFIVKDRLKGISGYIAHGIQDDLVPIEMARKSVIQLEKAGAEIDYCEKNAGHKLSSACFKEMESFFLRQVDSKF
jgi:phospholipase/carboxylesterase